MRRALVILLVLATQARADSWITPQARRLASPNQRWEAVITPAKDGKTGARTSIGAKGKAGTPFTTATAWMPVDAVLFDDGSLLVLDGWHRLGHGTVAALHDRDGSVRWSKTLEELVGKDMIAKVRVSVSSIWWRKTPLEWMLAPDGAHVLVTLIDENRLAIALANGATKIVEVPTLADDPERLFNRARALAGTAGAAPAALPLLERALAKDPDHSGSLLLAIELLQRTNEHARAVELAERSIARWNTTEGYNAANAHVALSRSYAALAQPKDAERALRRAIVAAPTYTLPALALAALLADQHRARDVDAVLDAFVARLFREPSPDLFALSDVAAYYQQRKAPAKALALVLKAYKRDEVTNQFLYASLAKLYEETGNTAEAIRVNEQLRAYFTKMGAAFDSYLKATEEDLARLRARKQ